MAWHGMAWYILAYIYIYIKEERKNILGKVDVRAGLVLGSVDGVRYLDEWGFFLGLGWDSLGSGKQASVCMYVV